MQIDIFRRVFRVKIHDHLERSDMNRAENNVFTVRSELAAGDVERVVISSSLHLSVEEESERCLAPRQVRVLPYMQITPDPILRVLRHILRQKSVGVSQSLRYVIRAMI